MSDDRTEVLDYLRASFARQDEQHEKTRRFLHEHAERLGRLESAVAGLRRDNADAYGQVVALSHRMDAMNGRLDRIERRLELVEPTH